MVLPLLIMPVSMGGTRYVFERSRKDAQVQKFRLAVNEAATPAGLLIALRAAGFEIIAAPDVRAAAEQRKADAGMEVLPDAGVTTVRIYSDQSEQIRSQVFRSRISEVLNRMRDERIRVDSAASA